LATQTESLGYLHRRASYSLKLNGGTRMTRRILVGFEALIVGGGQAELAMTQTESFLQVTDAAAFLGVSPNTIRNWGRDKKLPEYRHPLNNYRLYKRDDLEKVRKLLLSPVRANRDQKDSKRPNRPR
jgi:DNA (cytosine-5)-methyltransferase 1